MTVFIILFVIAVSPNFKDAKMSFLLIFMSNDFQPPEMTSRTKAKWITDFTIMPHYNKIIVGTG